MSDALISIVLPVYRQADHISSVVGDYEAALARIDRAYEIILSVNGSQDRSLDVCRELAQQYPTVQVAHSPQSGWGRAVRLGLQAAKGDLLCYTNSARTSAADLTLLLLYAVANPGVVIKANRMIRDNLRRRVGGLLYNLECRTLFDLASWDVNGTPKVFPRTLSQLLRLSRDDDLIDLEFNVICRREGYPMLEVPIFSTRRHGGRTTTNVGSAVRMYRGAYQLWRATRGAG